MDPAQTDQLLIRVVDVHCSPIVDATVTAPPSTQVMGIANSSGRIGIRAGQLDFGDGETASLVVSHDRYAPKTLRIGRSTRSALVVMLARTQLQVRVQNESGLWVAGAQAVFSNASGVVHFGPKTYRSVSDANGGMTINVLEPGYYRLVVMAEGHEVHESQIALRPGRNPDLLIMLKNCDPITIRVLDDKGKPIEGATVSLKPQLHDRRWTSETDKTGEARFPTTPKDLKYPSLRVSHSNFPALESLVTIPDDRRLDVRLMRPASISVNVTEGGRPLTQGNVTIEPRGYGLSTKPLNTGLVSFKDIPAGIPLELRVNVAGAVVRYVRGLVLQTGETKELNVQLDSMVQLALEVRDSHGNPVSGKVVMRNHEERYVQATDPHGQVKGTDSIRCTFRIDKGMPNRVMLFPGSYSINIWTDHNERLVEDISIVSDRTLQLTTQAPSANPDTAEFLATPGITSPTGPPMIREGAVVATSLGTYEIPPDAFLAFGAFKDPQFGKPSVSGTIRVTDGNPLSSEVFLIVAGRPYDTDSPMDSNADMDLILHAETVTSTVDGHFAFNLMPGRWHIKACDDLLEGSPVNFTVEYGKSVSGLVMTLTRRN